MCIILTCRTVGCYGSLRCLYDVASDRSSYCHEVRTRSTSLLQWPGTAALQITLYSRCGANPTAHRSNSTATTSSITSYFCAYHHCFPIGSSTWPRPFVQCPSRPFGLALSSVSTLNLRLFFPRFQIIENVANFLNTPRDLRVLLCTSIPDKINFAV